MIVILDYDVGNLASVLQSFKKAGMDAVVSKDPGTIQAADALILPGVGAFAPAMDALRASGLIPYLKEHVDKKKPLLGICLGMQLLFESSDEHGLHEGLGLLPGKITHFDISLNIPHMGWNGLKFDNESHPLLKYIEEGDYVYFVHSYYAVEADDTLVASAEYEVNVPAIVAKNNVYGMQFHPEKSGPVGSRILKAFKELIP